jgi:hypothetical protein
MYVLKSSPPCVVGFCTCFLCLCLGLSILYQGVGKFVRLWVFKLHHKASTNLCDDFIKTCAYCSVRNSR